MKISVVFNVDNRTAESRNRPASVNDLMSALWEEMDGIDYERGNVSFFIEVISVDVVDYKDEVELRSFPDLERFMTRH